MDAEHGPVVFAVSGKKIADAATPTLVVKEIPPLAAAGIRSPPRCAEALTGGLWTQNVKWRR